MNCRKLLTRREEYLKSIEDSPEQSRASTHFYNQLRGYYKRKWNVNLQFPRVNGVEVDLYKLYVSVKKLGGWCRVTNADRWSDIAREVMGLGEDTVSADYCARLVYMRYLSKFEQFEQGTETDDHDSEIMGSRNRMRGYSLFVSAECPIPCQRREPPDDLPQYEKLVKSLASGLPNEIDFALNVCAIMSAAGPFAFDLEKNSGLITLIVAQAGVFDDNSDVLQQEFLRTQKRTTKRDFGHFWSTAGIEDPDVLKIFPMVTPNKYSKLDYDLFPLLKDEDHNQKHLETVEFRIQQVLDIIRNLTFEMCNQPILANNWACLKFLVICIATEIYELRNSALDALSELASQICLSSDMLTSILLRFLRSFLFSDDRILVMRAAEVIGALCVNAENESIMSDFLEADILRRFFELISAKDVLICVNTLDSLYNISEAGRAFCERLAQVPRGIELLVNFCTIEASQFTTNGLYGIKVIEYQNNHDHTVGHPMRPSTSYYHPQQTMHSRALPAPLQPLPMGSTSARPQVIVSSKGDIAVATNKPILAAQLARPVISVNPNTQAAEYPKREIAPNLNGSQVKQIRIVNGNGEPIVIQQASTSIVESNPVKDEAADTQQNDAAAESVLPTDESVSSLNVEEEEEEKMNVDEEPSTYKADAVTSVEAGKNEQDLTANSQPTEEDPAVEAENSSTPNEGEDVDALNANTEDEEKAKTAEEKHVLNGSDHLNKTGNDSEHPPFVNGLVKSSDTGNDDEQVSNDKLLLNGVQHPKENGCVKLDKESKTNEKPVLNGAIKKPSTKTKKRAATDEAADPDTNGSSSAKKAKASPKKKSQKNGYIEAEEVNDKPEVSTSTAQPNAAQTLYARIPHYMCEWNACTNYFHTASAMIYHILHGHIDSQENREACTSDQASTSNSTSANFDLFYCRWPGCEQTPRSKWSLITHLQEHHCNENALNIATRKRREIGDFNYVATIKQRLQEVTPAANHTGYTKFAAYDAIRRHAFNYLTRDITEDHQEGPVTKDLRLTSALILRNLAKNSAECRKRLRPHEGYIAYMSMSRLESAVALAQCLAALNPADF